MDTINLMRLLENKKDTTESNTIARLCQSLKLALLNEAIETLPQKKK